MLDIHIPGSTDAMRLVHLVCDINGTLAEDGQLLDGVAGRLAGLSHHLSVHLLTADTHNTLDEVVRQIASACVAVDAPPPKAVRVIEGTEKEHYVNQLGPTGVVVIGNGANDERMLRVVRLGMVVIGTEGAYVPALLAATIVTASPLHALDLLLYPERLVATLRP